MNMFEEIKIYEPENLHKYKRMHDINMEIKRLNCILSKGYLSSKMFDEVVLKLDKLENEYYSLISPLIMKNEKKYHIKYMELSHQKSKEVLKKFKFTKCEYCPCLIPYENGDFCPDDECESHYI